ncbi:Hsp20/alpha crystallin family protein [bacterium]|nr:Hsp20/alpha crystallin family protein [bacterium]
MATFHAGIAPRLEDVRDEFDRLWTSLTTAPPLHGWPAAPAERPFPAVNVAESDEALVVETELPGLDAGDVDISVAGDELVLRGSRAGRPEQPEGDGEQPATVTWHRRERGSGTFERRIELPVAVDATRVEARLVDGVLTVTCPKAPQAQPRRVTVRSS